MCLLFLGGSERSPLVTSSCSVLTRNLSEKTKKSQENASNHKKQKQNGAHTTQVDLVGLLLLTSLPRSLLLLRLLPPLRTEAFRFSCDFAQKSAVFEALSLSPAACPALSAGPAASATAA